MDQTVIDIVFGVIGLLFSIAGWILKSIHSALKELKVTDQQLADKVTSIEVLVAGNYVKREYLDERAKEMFTLLYKIYDKLDTKLDK